MCGYCQLLHTKNTHSVLQMETELRDWVRKSVASVVSPKFGIQGQNPKAHNPKATKLLKHHWYKMPNSWCNTWTWKSCICCYASFVGNDIIVTFLLCMLGCLFYLLRNGFNLSPKQSCPPNVTPPSHIFRFFIFRATKAMKSLSFMTNIG